MDILEYLRNEAEWVEKHIKESAFNGLYELKTEKCWGGTEIKYVFVINEEEFKNALRNYYQHKDTVSVTYTKLSDKIEIS